MPPDETTKPMATKPKTIDDYLASLSDDQRTALEKLRKTIKAAAPKAEECISYQIPAFRLNGRMLVGFGATANHCAFYPMSSSTVKTYKDELKALRDQQRHDPISSRQTLARGPREAVGKGSHRRERILSFRPP
jgi:uncharacterized protein YdhG (YjbR/CyaY superfamily)